MPSPSRTSPYHMTEDMDRVAALCDLLGCRPNDVVMDGSNRFRVNVRQEREGTGPDEARERLDLLRKALTFILADRVATLTTDTFAAETLRARQDADEIDKLDRLIEGRTAELNARELPSYNEYEVSEVIRRRRKVIRRNEPVSGKEIREELRARVRNADLTLQGYRERREAAERRMNIRLTYRNMTREMYAHPEAAALLKLGIHDVLNTLYFLCPETNDYQSAEEYRAMLRALFDGREWEDTRKMQEVNDGEFLVLTDDEADDMAREYIEQTVWAFRPGFLAPYAGMPEEAVQALQEQMSDGCNEIMRRAVDAGGNFEALVKEAINADGRGHFLNSYDGKEYPAGDYIVVVENTPYQGELYGKLNPAEA